MHRNRTHGTVSLLGFLLSAAMALGAAACSSDDATKRTTATPTTSTPQAAKAPPTPESPDAMTETPKTDAGAKASAIRLDKSPIGTLESFRDGMRFRTQSGNLIAFPSADELHVTGLVDLARSGGISITTLHTDDLRRKGMKQPAVLLVAREKRDDGASSTTAALFDPISGNQLWHERVERRAADGFGGHSIENLAIERNGDELAIVGVRQDRLPKRRSRCRRPPAAPVRYVWDGSRFVLKTRLETSTPRC